MKKFTKKIKSVIPNSAYELIKKYYLYIKYLKDYFKFQKLSNTGNRFTVIWKNRNPQLLDNTETTGFDRHYTYHPAWAARIIKQINPKIHTDISSILQFSTILSAFIPVEFYDFRPANIKLNNLKLGRADLTSLPFSNNSIPSLSCMHTVEHVGLGRYGDPIDPDGDLKAISELKRVLAPNGNLLFVVPIGKPKIQFNAHRIYSYDQIVKYFSELKLEEFSLIPEITGDMIKNATKEQADAENYGCGCFWFKK